MKRWIIIQLLKATHRLWNREISRVLCIAYSKGLINSKQLHSLSAAFDPTQRHQIYGRGRTRWEVPADGEAGQQ